MGIKTVVLKDELGIIAYTLEQMGFDLAAFYEADRKSAEMCRHNLKGGCIQRDILECPEADIPDMEFLAAQLPHRVLTGLQGLGTGMDPRYLHKYMEIIRQKRPQVILLETFPVAVKGESFAGILSELEKTGYQFTFRLCDIGKVTGLPVNEKRVYLVGVLGESGRHFYFPEELPEWEGLRQPGEICLVQQQRGD